MRKGTKVKANIDITDLIIFHSGSGVVAVKSGTHGIVVEVDNSLLDIRFDNGRHIWVAERYLDVLN